MMIRYTPTPFGWWILNIEFLARKEWLESTKEPIRHKALDLIFHSSSSHEGILMTMLFAIPWSGTLKAHFWNPFNMNSLPPFLAPLFSFFSTSSNSTSSLLVFDAGTLGALPPIDWKIQWKTHATYTSSTATGKKAPAGSLQIKSQLPQLKSVY